MESNKNSTSPIAHPFPLMETHVPQLKEKRRKKVTFKLYSPIPNEETHNFSSSNNINTSSSFRHWCVAPVNSSIKFTLDPDASKLLKRRRERQLERKNKMVMENNKL
jgi:hypothetical protein